MDYARIRPATEQLTTEVVLKCEDDGDKRRRRFSMLAYSGSPVSRAYGKAVFSISGIEHKAKVPILFNHDETRIVGYADSVDMTGDGLRLSGVLSEATPEGRQIAELADEGFPWEASIGIAVESWEDLDAGDSRSINGLDVDGPVAIGTRSRLLEVSFVTAGADKNTAAVVMGAVQKEEVSMTDTRAELSAFLAEFPDREGWAAKLFAEGKTVAEAKLELAEETKASLAAAKTEIAALREQVAALEADKAAVASLRTESRTPGVGFDAPARESVSDSVDTSNLSPEQAWETDAKLRGEFFNLKEAFMAFVAREGWE